MQLSTLLYLLLAILSFLIKLSWCCNRKPQGATGERSPVDENYQILFEGNPSTYIPGQQYNVSLSCASGLKFISFTLVTESDNPNPTIGYDMLGHFELLDVAETKFSMACENMIENTNTNTKTRIDVAWVAPTNPESGCVLIKAAVLQHRNVWFIDDGFLTKRICPEEIDEMNGQTPPMNPCCACDEAKYEILLERRWTRNTHSKDFPSEAWRTRFSELIGASHTSDYRFWEYGGRASQGLREMAEHGATQNLEAEIKSNLQSGQIRTIIKAPGIGYRQNIVGTTLANVRVDPQHHVISLVTKVIPSPDWILGVAGLELCLLNCTWIERKVLNLYPWDVGTDAGASYMSPDQPQVPPDVIRRITSTFPSDYRSPFYDDSGAPMKPLGTLHITRRKLYERDCDVEQNVPVECAVHPWNAWNECSTKCGPGTQFRVRAYKDPQLAASFNCQMVLRQMQNCIGEQCGIPDDGSAIRQAGPECELSNWSAWSGCSKRCGKGYATRTRDYKNPYAREKCQSAGLPIELEQMRDCLGNDCGGSIGPNYDNADEQLAQQYDNFNEPGVLMENYSNNRSPQSGYGDHGSTDSMPEYGKTQLRQPPQFSNRQPRLNTASNYNSPPPFDEQSVPAENIYGNEMLIGQPPGKQFSSSSSLDTRSQQYGSSAALNYNQVNQQSPTYKQTTERYNSRFTTTRSPFVGYIGANTRTTIRPSGRHIANAYDESMHAINYAVIQEYCFERPVASLEPCRRPKIVLSNYWFYDAEDRLCKLFTADNCDENKNKFRTLEACEGTCLKPQQNQEGDMAGGLLGGMAGGMAGSMAGGMAGSMAGGMAGRRPLSPDNNWSNAGGTFVSLQQQNSVGGMQGNNQQWLASPSHASNQQQQPFQQQQQFAGSLPENEQWTSTGFGEPQSQMRGYQNRRNTYG